MDKKHMKILFEYEDSSDSAFDIKANTDVLQKGKLGQSIKSKINLPNVCEREVIKHYTKLSQKNFSIDTNFYPLGSCTMKYNPRINERTAGLEGFAKVHPKQPHNTIQGCLEVMYELKNHLCSLTGFYDATLNPAAGAQGEFCGIALIKKAIDSRGEKREYIIVPESAHGTNPATAAICGFKILSSKVKPDGLVDTDEIQSLVNQYGKNIAGIMVTNPNTCGLFEKDAKKISSIIHSIGGFFYCDGANFNAIVGKIKPADFGADVMHFNLHKTFSTPHGCGGPGSGPVACSKELSKHLPTPKIIKKPDGTFDVITEDQNSIGQIKGFFGQFLVYVRALTYIKTLGHKGLSDVSENSILAANYIYHNLKDVYDAPYLSESVKYCMHECLLTDKIQKKEYGVTTLDIAKTLLEYDMHSMTTFFPLVVQGAMLIEPTETETIETLNFFINTMKEIASLCKTDPQSLKNNPVSHFRKRLDDVMAAKTPVLTFKDLLNSSLNA